MLNKMTRLALFLAILALILPQVVLAGPKEDIQGTVEQVIEILKQKDLPVETRREKLSQLIRSRFDFEVMSQSTLGLQWRNASAEDKQRFIELYTDLLKETYLGRIDDYSDEQVEFGDALTRGDKALVNTKILTKTAEIPIDYKLVERPQGWLVYDVVIEGVSLIRNFRNSYGEIIDKEGFPGLFARMEQKVAELKQ